MLFRDHDGPLRYKLPLRSCNTMPQENVSRLCWQCNLYRLPTRLPIRHSWMIDWSFMVHLSPWSGWRKYWSQSICGHEIEIDLPPSPSKRRSKWQLPQQTTIRIGSTRVSISFRAEPARDLSSQQKTTRDRSRWPVNMPHENRMLKSTICPKAKIPYSLSSASFAFYGGVK